MSTHANMVKMSTATTGTGTITLGSASSGYQSFADAFGANATVDVLITDGTAWEVARNCTYTHSGTTLTRGTWEDSSNGTGAISLSGAAVVSVVATAGAANAAETVLTYADRAASYGFGVVSNAAQTCTDAAYELLHGATGGALQGVEWNVGSIWSADANGRVTPPAGRWQFYGQISVSSVAANQRVFLALYKNGTLYRMLGRSGGQGSTTQSSGTGGSCIGEANGSDYFDWRLFVDGAGTHAAGGDGQTYAGCEYRGPIL